MWEELNIEKLSNISQKYSDSVKQGAGGAKKLIRNKGGGGQTLLNFNKKLDKCFWSKGSFLKKKCAGECRIQK